MLSRIIYGFLFVLYCGITIHAQQSMGSFLSIAENPDSLLIPNTLRFGTDKLANTFLFSADADAHMPLSIGGFFTLKQRYRGTVMRTNTLAVRDDQGMQLLYHTPIGNSVYALSQLLWFTTEDSRNIGLQSARRTGGYIGLGYKHASQINAEGGIGYEANEQLGVKAGGLSFYGNSVLHPMQVSDDLSWKGYASGNYTQIDSMRTIANMDILLSTFSMGSPYSRNRLVMEVRSKLLNRDFYTPIAGIADSLAIERRLEHRISLNTELGFEISQALYADLFLTVESADIDRLYRQSLINVPSTAVNRNLQELTINLSGSVQYKNVWGGIQSAGFSLFSRDEKNSVIPIFTILPVDEDGIRRQEFLRDNTSNRLRLFAQSLQPLGRFDTLILHGSASLLRYDTPSESNYDDRDEQLLIADLQWTKKIHQSLLFRIESGIQFTHLVFLKAQRSSLNNWNRIIRFSTGVDWNNSILAMHPRCEVLANYTVYDFEISSAPTKSYSFRQMSYRDSIIIALYKGWTLETRIFGRIFERGMLSWQEFSETPITSSSEQFYKMLMFAPVNQGLKIGLGARYYALSQNAVSNNSTGYYTSPNAQMRMFGPEMSISAQFKEGSTLSMQGWYEWQYNGDTLFRKQVNVLLQASLNF